MHSYEDHGTPEEDLLNGHTPQEDIVERHTCLHVTINHMPTNDLVQLGISIMSMHACHE